jgi:hypothetical protein
MNCREIQKRLALNISGDGDPSESSELTLHLHNCTACSDFHEQLTSTRSLLRELRSGEPPAAAMARARAGVLECIENSRSVLGWRIRLERFLISGVRRPRFAVATSAAAVLFSMGVFAQMRWASANGPPVAVLEGDTLNLPERYREWVFVGSSTRLENSAEPSAFQNVYISPEAYREYQKSGKFPDGAVLVMESAVAGSKGVEEAPGHYGKELLSVKVSVKDSRFREGWGYFEFKDQEKRVRALPESAGCLACHRNQGATDHVFTQFYPVLRAAAAVL